MLDANVFLIIKNCNLLMSLFMHQNIAEKLTRENSLTESDNLISFIRIFSDILFNFWRTLKPKNYNGKSFSLFHQLIGADASPTYINFNEFEIQMLFLVSSRFKHN